MNIGTPVRVWEADPNTAPATYEEEETLPPNKEDQNEIERLIRELEEVPQEA